MFGASWRTSVFGLLAAVGAAILGLYLTIPETMATLPVWLKGLAAVLSATGSAGIGLNARDDGVTSEEAGAKQPPTT